MLNHNRPRTAVVISDVVEREDPATAKTTPTQDLIMYLLWAQERHEKHLISIPAKLAGSVDRLERLGVLWSKHGVAQGTIEIGLTDTGRKLMDPNMKTPLQEKYEAAQVTIRELRNALVHQP